MVVRFALTDYVDAALRQAEYEKLEDGTYGGRIPSCEGVIAFDTSLRACEEGLRSTLEDWLLLGLKMSHPLPIIAGIDLNQRPVLEPLDAL